MAVAPDERPHQALESGENGGELEVSIYGSGKNRWSAVGEQRGGLNYSGVALVLAVARYLHRRSLWCKDAVFLITADWRARPQAWVDAYHDLHSDRVEPPGIKCRARWASWW